MKTTIFRTIILIVICTFFIQGFTRGQDKISWLSDYTTEVNTGTYTYQYNFYSVDNNSCKIKIEEIKTDKKGKSSTTTNVFYLSDLDPKTLSFKPSGKLIVTALEIKLSQKFISVYKDENLDGYSSSLTINMDDVDKARSFIEVLKSKITNCGETDVQWTSAPETFTWLINNIGEISVNGKTIGQKFNKGDKSYLAQFDTKSQDSKGNQVLSNYLFDLSDIDPRGITLVISGNNLKTELQVKDKKYYIAEKINDEAITFTREIEIYSDDIEKARNITNALIYLVSNTKSERKEWTNSSQSLTFVKDNLKEVSVGSESHKQSLVFEDTPSGLITFTSEVTSSKGTSAEVSSFYLNDISPEIELNVTSKYADIEIKTKDNAKYIKITNEGKIQTYNNSLKIYLDNIDMARDMMLALKSAISSSKSGVQEFATFEKSIQWLTKAPVEVVIDSKKIIQSLVITPNNENSMELQITTEEGGTTLKEQYFIYPEDISPEDLVIKVSGKKLYLPLSTGKLKYIKAYKENELQNFVTETEILFEDVLMAKNFQAAILSVHNKSKTEKRSFKDKVAAWDYLVKHLVKIENSSESFDQQIEKIEGNECKLKYTRIETDSKGASSEYIFEFTLTDIDQDKCSISVSGKEIKVNLITRDRQKLIKPYKNGEAENFCYDFDMYFEDVLVAKKVLAAFSTLTSSCK
ncbi:MAG: hypothetical protein JXJ22_15325 [Bacteroidales bacterium]|nr:hypothetical protein [Bacteroidales bacterium]